ncbi:MAG: peptidylprolyl isomerase [bacterium]
MKIQKLIVIVILFFGISINVYSQQKTRYVKVAQENIRLEPSGKILGRINSGTTCEVLEEKPQWVKVKFAGWIWKESLTSDKTMISGFTVRASHILVNSQETAQEILNKIKQGASFVEMAKQYSIDKSSGRIGGDLGSFGRGDLNPAFEKAVFKLKVGEISSIVKTDLGYHIIKRTK